MQKKRLPHLIVSLALAAAAVDAGAMGFAAASASTTLGQALDHVIGLRLDDGESLSPECVTAEVTVGEQRLPAAAVRTRLEGEGARPSLRVLTTVAIDEPLVAVTVSVGCPTRLSRRFVLFADPAPAAMAGAPVAVPVDSVTAAAPAPPPAAVAAEPRAVPPPPRERPSAAAAAPRPPRAVARRAPADERAATPAPVSARPRLRLDAAEPAPPRPPVLTAEMLEAAASAAAAQAAAQAASAAAQRIAALEQAIDRLRADSAADREALRVLRQRAATSDVQARWMPWLLALVAALALLCGWLALRLRRLQRERQQAWWNAAAAGVAPAATAAATASTPAAGDGAAAGVPPSTGGYTTTRPATLGPVFAPDPAPGDPSTESPGAAERTQVLPLGWRADSGAERDVSIEELIDLEQQAEFFVVLGQDEAAIDLLVDHLRSTGGGSPMPYLKLLEIYRRRGDREAYDRTRARFNHRFNATAPDWDDDPSQGRSLEDYPAIVGRLQMAWPSPIDAMAELESLLFRKARGELFDMPAYRDVMFLYSLARDLLDREPLESGQVDVLLPINEGTDRTQPMALGDRPPVLDSGMVPLEQPTVPVDLDVTQPVMPESLFGENATDPGIGAGRRRRNPV